MTLSRAARVQKRLSKRRAASGARQREEIPLPDRTDEQVDESLEESFPCSDPPSWTVVVRVGASRRHYDRAAPSPAANQLRKSTE
jgi:hypothetical protein